VIWKTRWRGCHRDLCLALLRAGGRESYRCMRSTPNPLQRATEIEAAGNPENQMRATRERFRLTSRVLGVNRQGAYEAWLLFSFAYP
jgi:hypothetical protein